MPKNKGKGGKKFRKGAHGNLIERVVEYKNSYGEAYATALKCLGHGRISVECYIDNYDYPKPFDTMTENEIKEHKKKIKEISSANRYTIETRLGIICGFMRKRKRWVNPGNIVIVSLRDFQQDKCDIVHVYSASDVHKLICQKRLPDLDSISKNYSDDINFKHEMEPEIEIKKQERHFDDDDPYNLNGMPDYSDEDEDESEDEAEAEAEDEAKYEYVYKAKDEDELNIEQI